MVLFTKKNDNPLMKINNLKLIVFYKKIDYIYKIYQKQFLLNISNNYSKSKMSNQNTDKKRYNCINENESYVIKKKTKLIPKINRENLNQNNINHYFSSKIKETDQNLNDDIKSKGSHIDTINKTDISYTKIIEKENFKDIQDKRKEHLDVTENISKINLIDTKNIIKTFSEENNSKDCHINKVQIIVTWNMNSITVRYKNKEKWKEFMNFFNKINADILCFQEVRLPALNLSDCKNNNDNVMRDRSKVKNTDQKSLVDFQIMDTILKNDFKNYNAYFSLANIKYSGQLVLIKKTIQLKSVRYNLSFNLDSNIHHDEGRVILVEFSDFFLLSTYTPNNGFDYTKFERRRLFDEELEKFVASLKNKKPLIWTGDLNIAPEDIDLSHPAEFRRMKKNDVPKEFIGQPGCTDFERKNFKKILSSGDLVDSYRYFQNLKSNKEDNKNKLNINENIYTWRCPFRIGKLCNKAMRIDHFIVSKNFLKNIEKVEIHGYSVFHNNFYGSDHCPVILYLKNIDKHDNTDNKFIQQK
ncbi:AP endonuclease (DNA-[apurinic or apyrimidinic site] lyase), putative [Plasmodium gallinaceum]|uniref:DNA-(apurinic or apyrimidinic site) endonuclease n=1 Tax=Plasmodium gallinaceum TaxID=5849 RepID=A0A1J1GS77_PLAGA|nr:AP endonuclease (DNA-[apurinic or apyrimidinic site] lyase), putative [Plasmodium gallinaceum]CRG95284.1 AP endonuclease (DNA-[apurinic or apyrimidinic site] lyase), putative [Plasmodium gallinaceum]